MSHYGDLGGNKEDHNLHEANSQNHMVFTQTDKQVT